MSNLGSGDNGEFTFLDTLSLLSFIISVQNLGLNLTQQNKQELENSLNAKTEILLNEIHKHLAEQDAKIDAILEELHGP